MGIEEQGVEHTYTNAQDEKKDFAEHLEEQQLVMQEAYGIDADDWKSRLKVTDREGNDLIEEKKVIDKEGDEKIVDRILKVEIEEEEFPLTWCLMPHVLTEEEEEA